MYDLIHRALEGVRLLFAPGPGRHRRHHGRPQPTPVQPTPRLPRHRSPYGVVSPLDGTASALVRPYLLAHDKEAALRHRRRLALVLAADFGIDLDQHIVGAREVAA